MRLRQVTLWFGFATLLLCERSAAEDFSVKLRLLCDEQVILAEKPFLCSVLIENGIGAGPVLVPSSLLPGVLPHRPPTVLTFAVTEGGISRSLSVTPRAQRGRFDWGTMQAGELQELVAGSIIGWTFNLNGDIWLLPTKPGKYLLSATVKVHLLQPRASGSIDPAVVKAAGGTMARAKRLAMDGDWMSNSVPIEVIQGSHRP